MRLNELKKDEKAVIEDVDCMGPLKIRFFDLGLIPGTEVCVVGFAPLNDPMIIEVKGANFAVRRSDAARLKIKKVAL